MIIDGYLIKNFTDCSLQELTDILSWRNHEDVRRNSFNSDIISLENHLKYVKNLSHNQNAAYFLIYNHLNEALGVISFTGIDGTKADVGYYKSIEKAAEKGLGVILLSLAAKTALYIKHNGGGLHFLVTEVFSFNIGSIKSIERAGYKEIPEKRRQIEKDGKVTDVLYYKLQLK